MPDVLPSAEALAHAMSSERGEVGWQDRRLLVAQYRSPERTVSAEALQALTLRGSQTDTRLAYGRLARQIGLAAGWAPPHKGVTWTAALSETLPSGSDDEGVRWRLRPEAAEALVRAGWVLPEPTTDVERLQQSVDALTRLVLYLTDEVLSARVDLDAVRNPPEERFGVPGPDRKGPKWMTPEVIASVLIQQGAKERAMAGDVELLIDHWFEDL